MWAQSGRIHRHSRRIKPVCISTELYARMGCGIMRGNEPHTRGALTCANILMSDQESARIFYALSPQLRHTTK